MSQREYQGIKDELADLVEQLDIKASPDKKRIGALLRGNIPVDGAKLKQTERLEIK
jgi:hypothetical protein